MATIPTARTWTSSESTNAAMFNNLYDSQRFLFNAPSCSAFRGAMTACPSNTMVKLLLTGAYYDNDLMFLDTLGNVITPSRITFNTAGMYEVEMNMLWGANSSDGAPRFVGWIGLCKNSNGTWPAEGSANYVGSSMTTGGAASASAFPMCNRIYTVQPFAAGDYLNFFCKVIRDATWTVPAGASNRWAVSVAVKWVGN